MYLATVTCNRDFQQMLLQAESIQRFLSPCKHVIIVNESNPDLDFWYRWLQPYYTNHELVIRPRIEYAYPHSILGVRDRYGEIDSTSNGWRTQQLQKMLLAYEYEDDYLLLDSKNFFIKPTDLSEWNDIIGSGIYCGFGAVHHFVGSYKKYAELFKRDVDYYSLPSTPFKIKKEPLITNCTFEELGYKLFYPEHSLNGPASEGIFYSFYANDEISKLVGSPIKKGKIILIDDVSDGEKVDKNKLAKLIMDINKDPNMKTVAIHREVLSKVDDKDMKLLEFWLNSENSLSLKFKNKIYPMPRDSHI